MLMSQQGSQNVDNESLFDASFISVREIADRGLSFNPALLQKTPLPNTKTLINIKQEDGEILNTPTPSFRMNCPENYNVLLNPTPKSQSEADVDELIPLRDPQQSEIFLLTPINCRSSVQPQPTENSFKDLTKNIFGFDIETALMGSQITADIVTKKLIENRFILRCDRQAVAAVLIDSVIEKLGSSPSKLALEQLAQHLVQKFPKLGDTRRKEFGWQMWFFHAFKGSCATGFLEDRLKNQRKKLGRIRSKEPIQLAQIENLNWTSEDEQSNDPPEESQLEFLRQNFGPEIVPVMMSTVFTRRTLLRGYRNEGFTGTQKAMKSMPRLFDMENMIVQDFNLRHPSVGLILYDRWPKVSKLLLDYAEESGVNYKRKLDVPKSRYELTDDDVGLIAYCLLPYILPSCGRKVPEAESESEEDQVHVETLKRPKRRLRMQKKRQCTVKASDLDSFQSMISFRSKNTHLSEVLRENKRLAPYILALGTISTLEFEQFYIIIHKVAIPCGSKFLVALDTCAKCFTVLYLPFPIESYDHWLFIYHGVCGKPFQDSDLPPVVQALIGQIMCRI